MKENIYVTYPALFTLEELKDACEHGEILSSVTTHHGDGTQSTMLTIRMKVK